VPYEVALRRRNLLPPNSYGQQLLIHSYKLATRISDDQRDINVVNFGFLTAGYHGCVWFPAHIAPALCPEAEARPRANAPPFPLSEMHSS